MVKNEHVFQQENGDKDIKKEYVNSMNIFFTTILMIFGNSLMNPLFIRVDSHEILRVFENFPRNEQVY